MCSVSGGRNEGASSGWVLNDLNQRGVEDVLIACVDGLTGFPDAIEAVFPAAWVQTCIVHLIRNSIRWVSYHDRKRLSRKLRPIYTALTTTRPASAREFDRSGAAPYPMIAILARAAGVHVPFLALPADVRRIVYTTNTIETSTARSARPSKPAAPPHRRAARKLIYLAILNAPATGGLPTTGAPPCVHSIPTSETDCPTLA